MVSNATVGSVVTRKMSVRKDRSACEGGTPTRRSGRCWRRSQRSRRRSSECKFNIQQFERLLLKTLEIKNTWSMWCLMRLLVAVLQPARCQQKEIAARAKVAHRREEGAEGACEHCEEVGEEAMMCCEINSI